MDARVEEGGSIDEEGQVANEKAWCRQAEGRGSHDREEAGEDGSPAEAAVTPDRADDYVTLPFSVPEVRPGFGLPSAAGVSCRHAAA
jgi:hypothetical protein